MSSRGQQHPDDRKRRRPPIRGQFPRSSRGLRSGVRRRGLQAIRRGYPKSTRDQQNLGDRSLRVRAIHRCGQRSGVRRCRSQATGRGHPCPSRGQHRGLRRRRSQATGRGHLRSRRGQRSGVRRRRSQATGRGHPCPSRGQHQPGGRGCGRRTMRRGRRRPGRGRLSASDRESGGRSIRRGRSRQRCLSCRASGLRSHGRARGCRRQAAGGAGSGCGRRSRSGRVRSPTRPAGRRRGRGGCRRSGEPTGCETSHRRDWSSGARTDRCSPGPSLSVVQECRNIDGDHRSGPHRGRCPATSYSPTQSPAQYHRRRKA
jgi:hypothetical protein